MHLSILNSSRNIGRRAHGEGAEAIEERAEASIDGESLELEVKHKDNGSWHPCYVSLRSIFQSFRLEILRALMGFFSLITGFYERNFGVLKYKCRADAFNFVPHDEKI
ncbi:uncharacterized protein A4U43_C04F26630 [Asparagus officinalis]|uniref:Uncharacterized protein n=1 Tax=Asparagus officinalis TaxID=4686 RepID=A0A5P1F8S0_ASPOF|nr:uncharacterized protein A4U43_C04F26630 [Asparagus officinalis]